MFPIFAGSNPSGYNLTRSLRFRASASASLSRTPSSTGNRQIFTYSAWVKRGTLDATFKNLFYAYVSTSDVAYISINSSNQLTIAAYNGGSFVGELVTTQVFRDPSAWYHIVIAVDTTQATASNRIKMYVNGSQITAFATATYPPQNTNFYFNAQNIHRIAASDYPAAPNYFDGYVAEHNWIDGQALTPSSFGSTNATTGVWQPARYAGSYGTNGFYLPFTDNSALTTSSNVGLGKDFSGNGNYWTTNNISITSGVTYDSMTDVPTLTSATAANFAVLNPLDNGGATVNAANLNWDSGGNQGTRASFFVSSGKYYWEITSTEANLIGEHGVAPATKSLTGGDAYPGSTTGGWGFSNNSGNKSFNGTQTNITTAGTNGDVMMYALNMDTGKIWFGRNGTWFSSGDPAAGTNEAFSSVTGTLSPMTGVGGAAAGSVAYNFGQRPFTYTAPSGYVALNTYNLPTSTIVKGNTVMDATLYTGNATGQSVTNTAAFKPDLVWIKQRSAGTTFNLLYDSIRGVGKYLSSNSTVAEGTIASSLTAFNSNGFTVGTDPSGLDNGWNGLAATIVGWQWQAGQGTTSSNTSGSITSTTSVNASAGFSVVTYTGNGTIGATVGHGLGVNVALYFVKNRSATADWAVLGHALNNAYSGAYKYLLLNTTASVGIAAQGPGNSSTIELYNDATNNASGNTYVAYCFASIAGYSSIGSYTGNGNADGPFVYTGFRPKFLMLKSASNGAYGWTMWDSSRNTYNVVDKYLQANGSAAEGTLGVPDFLSNGFKLRTSDVSVNENGGTMIYIAFAENPFKNALAR